MKKIFLLCALIILATGCVNAKESSIPEYNSEVDGVSASEALHILYDSFELNERGTRDYPDDYAGYYLDGDFGQNNYVLVVIITDENSTRYDFFKGYENVRLETAEYSLNEMRKILIEMPSELMKELGLPYMGAQINMQQNIIELTFADTCTDEQKAVIDEYVKDKPVAVGYDPKSYPEVQTAV